MDAGLKLATALGNLKEPAKKRVCKTHIFSYWDPKYEHCVLGNKTGEICIPLEENNTAKVP